VKPLARFEEAFKGKTAIVTGGASGIGRAFGEALASNGARVVLADLQADRAREAADALVARGLQAEHAALDVVDDSAVEALVDRVHRDHGRLDFMFNNAGVAVVGNALKFALADFHRLIDVNVRGVVNGTYAAYRRMTEQRFGHIVNTASIAGLVPSPRFTAYAMTKHAVVGLSTSLRIEARRYGVRVSAVCPGVIDTPMVHGAAIRGEMDRGALVRDIPPYPVERCAQDVLTGVVENRPLIVVTRYAKIAYALHRLAPNFIPGLVLKRIQRAEKRS
jgi:NAD(P)-dependent dehydrogenase (short-subunit alcohol dehydrogenase family)